MKPQRERSLSRADPLPAEARVLHPPGSCPPPPLHPCVISGTRDGHKNFSSQIQEHGDLWGLKVKSSSSA